MPWIRRPSNRRLVHQLRSLRRWSYDHSEGLVSFWIGAAIVAIVVAAIVLVMG